MAKAIKNSPQRLNIKSELKQKEELTKLEQKKEIEEYHYLYSQYTMAKWKYLMTTGFLKEEIVNADSLKIPYIEKLEILISFLKRINVSNLDAIKRYEKELRELSKLKGIKREELC